MLTAILPVRTEHNSFWNSSKGMECIDKFFNSCACISDIDQYVVITQDESVCRLAEQQGMQISNVAIQGNPDRPYTFEQTRSLAQNFQNFCKNQSDALIVADHRNLNLTADDIIKFHKVYQKNPDNGLISLAFCRDYPCQLKTFFTFLGCTIIRIEKHCAKNGNSNKLQPYFPTKPTCISNDPAKIMVSASVDGSSCNISFSTKHLPVNNFIAQVIPFSQNGPQYEESQEIFVESPDHEMKLEIDPACIKGVIFIFTVPSQSGDYDTMELFTPENASWELGDSVSAVISKKNQKPMYGRRQFEPAYTYDGSLCILVAKHLSDKTILNFLPFVLEDSCIVTDWVDYSYTATTQQSIAEVGFEY